MINDLEHPKIPKLGYNGENGVLVFLVFYVLENNSKYFDDLLALR